MFNDIAELGKFVDDVYKSIEGKDSKYNNSFLKIISGCHCIPPTEWYGDIFLTFKTLLKEHAISDKDLAKQTEEVVSYLKQYYD